MASSFPQASPLFCAFLPLRLHLTPGCPTLQGSSSSWTASVSGPWNHPSSILHHPILRCSSCLLCYRLSRCLTCLLGPLVTSSSHGTPISGRPNSNLDLDKSSPWREGWRARVKVGQIQVKAEEQHWRPCRDNTKTQSLQIRTLPWSPGSPAMQGCAPLSRKGVQFPAHQAGLRLQAQGSLGSLERELGRDCRVGC